MGPYRQDDFAFGEYGFEDDGYDYSQHFRPRGQGHFMSASGVPLPPAAYNGGIVGAPAPEAGLTKLTLDALLNDKSAVLSVLQPCM